MNAVRRHEGLEMSCRFIVNSSRVPKIYSFTIRALEALSMNLVEPHALVMRNGQRKQRLKRVLDVLKRMRALQNNASTLNKLIEVSFPP